MDKFGVPKSADALPGHVRRSLSGSTHNFRDLHEKQESQAPLTNHMDLVALQTQTDQNRQKLAHMEKAIREVSRKLEDWTEVTKSGLDTMRSEIGAIKLEHRFTQTLRSTNSRDETTPRHSVTKNPGPPTVGVLEGLLETSEEDSGLNCKRLEAVEAACQDLRFNIQEVTSVPEATERLLKAELKQLVGQLRDELQLERTKAEQNAVDLIRVQAVGAELQRRMHEAEKRLSEVQQDHLTETVAVKGRLEVAVRECDQQLSRAEELQAAVKADVMQEVAVLQDNLQLTCSKIEQNSLDISRTEAAGQELALRLEESNRRLWELQQAQHLQTSEVTSVRTRLDVVVEESYKQIGQADTLRVLFQDQKDQQMAKASALLNRVEAVEQAMAVAPEVQAVSRLQKFENTCNELTCDGEPRAGALETSNVFGSALQQEREWLREALVQAKDECFNRMEEKNAELLATVQDALGRHNSALSAEGDVQQFFRNETLALGSRMDTLAQQLAALSQANASHAAQEAGQSSGELAMSAVLARVDDLEASRIPCVSREVLRLRECLEDVVNKFSAAAAASHSTDTGCSRTGTIDELRAALAATSGDVASLARDLAVVREEHDAAIAGIGGLTEYVARTAATSIQRTEERLAQELAAKRQEFEKITSAQRDTLNLAFQTRMAKAAATVERSRYRHGCAQNGLDAYALGTGSVSQDGESHLEDSSRLDAFAMQLRSEAAAQAAMSEARISAVEAVFNADLKRVRGMLSRYAVQVEESQATVRDMRSRMVAIETTVAAQACKPAPLPQMRCGEERRQSKSPVPRAREVQKGQAWHNTFHKVMQTPSPSVLPAANFMQQRLQGQHIQEGLKEKLEGIASSVHQVLGALSMQQWQLTDPTSGCDALNQLPASVVSSVTPAAAQHCGQSAKLPTHWDVLSALPMVGRLAVPPGREQSPLRESAPAQCPAPHDQLLLPVRCARDSLPKPTDLDLSPVRCPRRDPSPTFSVGVASAPCVPTHRHVGHRQPSPEPPSSTFVPGGNGGRGSVVVGPHDSLASLNTHRSCRGRSEEGPGRTLLKPTLPLGRHAATLTARGACTQPGIVTSSSPGTPITGIASAAAAAFVAAPPGIRARKGGACAAGYAASGTDARTSSSSMSAGTPSMGGTPHTSAPTSTASIRSSMASSLKL